MEYVLCYDVAASERIKRSHAHVAVVVQGARDMVVRWIAENAGDAVNQATGLCKSQSFNADQKWRGFQPRLVCHGRHMQGIIGSGAESTPIPVGLVSAKDGQNLKQFLNQVDAPTQGVLTWDWNSSLDRYCHTRPRLQG